MWPLAALFVVLLVTSASASVSSMVTIPLIKHHRTGAFLKGSPDAARARATFLRSGPADRPTTMPVTNLRFVQYTARIGIGKPPTYYNLIVDTGSSNTFCGTGISYVRTPTSIPTGQNVTNIYGTGNMTGKEYLDQVTLGANLVIANQSIGDALYFSGFPDIDGIIGFGPVDITQDTLSPDVNATIPTVMNNLVSQGLIEKQVLGIYMAPSTSFNDTNGALTYGGVDQNLYEGEITYVPVTETSPSSFYWGINITLATYGTDSIIPVPTAGIVDSGTNAILLADDFFQVYINAIPGATLDPQTGLIDIPPSSIASMKPLEFLIAGSVFTLDVDAQLIPPVQNAAWGGVAGKRYGLVTTFGAVVKSGSGLDFILGMPFMERYYTVFDADANRVGIARTNNTFTIHQGC